MLSITFLGADFFTGENQKKNCYGKHFKSERNLTNMCRSKDRVPYDLVSGVVYEYTREIDAIFPIMVRQGDT